MQTRISDKYLASEGGREAERILRSCVHCGFCNATCPTYQLTGDELDGPRGRIYLIKQMLEGQAVSDKTRLHLDRCLSCRACETTCPSGVEYHRLLDIGRAVIDQQLTRPMHQRVARWLLACLLSSKRLFAMLLGIGQRVRPLMPALIRDKIPGAQQKTDDVIASIECDRSVILLEGCVQDALLPNINHATRSVFAKFGIQCQVMPKAECCGAANYHLDEVDRAKQQARANIDAWWPLIAKNGAEAVIINASACGLFAKDYKTLLRDDTAYRDKAARVAELSKDPSEFLQNEPWEKVFPADLGDSRYQAGKVAFHPPCTLQHGQKLNGAVEQILERLGVELLPFSDAHLCCGSAGTYSLTQPEFSAELKRRKLEALEAVQPEQIVTANVGCQSHLSSGANVPVRHWLELVADFVV